MIIRDLVALAVTKGYSADEILEKLAELPVDVSEDQALSFFPPKRPPIAYEMPADPGNFAINGRELSPRVQRMMGAATAVFGLEAPELKWFPWEGTPRRREGQITHAIMWRITRRFGVKLLEEMGQEKREAKIRKLVARHTGSPVSERTIRDVWAEQKRRNLATAQFVQTWTAKAKKIF